ncbi:maleate cis-trans isomerase family protein [Aliiroseovarius lamellibrachiae]|uniref:maleate cis-trans isomerase family protein n=1 Tax=Aliiroseovarius lamellibrachiae TaxID=1924933 RepID=UPI001BE06090|nr:aspartate/glutamate racemase family protein [Aliiroseovarius lamellibrachiae]MBT2132437.1 aspartate/glutamate racemase family protein [Aliiroseovarius lamellibrachiae]
MKLDFQTDDGIGTRANMGVIVLETDETLEHEFAQMMDLDGVALYHSRIPMVAEIKPETLAQMEADLPASARLLPKSLSFDVIGYGCTSASTVIGSDKVAAAIRSVCPTAQVTDPLAAIIAAGKHLGAQKLGFVTPYVAEVSAQMRGKLEDAGFEITGFGSFEEGNDQVVARITEASIVNAAERVAKMADCDALVISCTNLRCLNIIDDIEARTGVAVISSNQALAWHMQKLAGLTTSRKGMGRLYTAE